MLPELVIRCPLRSVEGATSSFNSIRHVVRVGVGRSPADRLIRRIDDVEAFTAASLLESAIHIQQRLSDWSIHGYSRFLDMANDNVPVA